MGQPLSDLAASFRRDLRAEGKAPRTAELYLQSITYFSNWLRSEGQSDSLDNLTRPNIRTWLAGLTERNENSTVRTRYKGLRRFCRWLVAEDILDTDPMDGMEPPPAQNKPVPILTDDELTAVLKQCQGKGFETRRNEALIRVLMDTGCRVSELVGITLEDLDLDRESATVTGKGNKVRPLYFSAKTARALDRYLRERAKHRYASDPALFLSQRGRMSGDGVRDLVHRLGVQAGIDDLHPHRFRHTFAHDFLVSGGQERDLKRLAGWSSDVMLERYGASAADQRAEQAARRLRRGDRV